MYGVLALKYCERVPSSAKVHSAPALVHAAPRDPRTRVRAGAAHPYFQTRVKKLRPFSRTMFLEYLESAGWCFQHRVGGMQLEESDMTCQVTWSSSRTSRAARRDSMVAGSHRTATAAAGLKDTASIATVISPHAGRRRVNGQGYGRAPDHGLSSSMAPKRLATSVPC